jgi:hypothetical protein
VWSWLLQAAKSLAEAGHLFQAMTPSVSPGDDAGERRLRRDDTAGRNES